MKQGAGLAGVEQRADRRDDYQRAVLPRRRRSFGAQNALERETTLTIVRLRIDPATRAYVTRRRAEDRTTKEIMRSLKRYITRQLFRTLAAAHPVPA